MSMPVVIERGSLPHRALQLIGWVALAAGCSSTS